MATEDLTSAAAALSASATKAVETSLNELHRLELQNIRLRAALREALEMVRVGCDAERFDVLWAFLNGEREGL
jgi:hypothetical protein